MLHAIGFDLQRGFIEPQLRDLVEKEVDWLPPKFRDPSNGYYLAAGIKILLGGKGKGGKLPRGYSAEVPLRHGAVTLRAGQHGTENMLQACRINRRATVFLSHCQAEPVRDTLAGMEDFANRASKSSDEAVFWLDFFGLDQNNITWTKDKERTKSTIMGPTTLAVMMSPWEGGMTLQRAWCCLEIALHALVGHDIVVVLTPLEKQRFLDAFRKDYTSIMNNLCTVDVLKADASKKQDLEWVLNEMQAVEGGVPKINQIIISSIFDALTQVARSAVESAAHDKEADAQADALCNNLARLLQARGEFGAEPEALLRLALEIGETSLGPQHPDVAGSCSNLATLLFHRGEHGAEPEALLRRALEIGETSLGPQHPSVATFCSILAALLQARGDYGAEPEALLRRALEIDEKALGPQHPSVATCCSNLAALLHARGEYGAEPEALLRRALEIDEKALGPQHPNVAAGCNNLALLLQARGDYGAEPERLMRRSLEIDEKALGPQHPSVATSCNNLARLLQARGDYGAEPERLMRRALEISETALGPQHPNVATMRRNLARFLRARG